MIKVDTLKKAATTAGEIAIMEVVTEAFMRERREFLEKLRARAADVGREVAKELDTLYAEKSKVEVPDLKRMGHAHADQWFRERYHKTTKEVEQLILKALDVDKEAF